MQRKLLNALLATLATTALIGALLPMMALGHDGGSGSTCPEGGEWSSHFDDGTHTETGVFGSITMTGGSESDELLTADINEGYTVEICVKQASDHTHFTDMTSENDGTVWDGDLSHWSYLVTGTPSSTTSSTQPTTTTTEGSTTSTTQASTTTTDSSTTTEPTLSSTTTTTSSPTTTVASSTTSTSDPATTTSTTEPTTTSTTQSSSSTTTSDESPGSTLPFTGLTDNLAMLALSLLSAGTLIVLATRERRSWSSR